MTSQNTEAGAALTDALNAGILALNTLQNPDATSPADADQLDAITDSALDVLVRLRDVLADGHVARFTQEVAEAGQQTGNDDKLDHLWRAVEHAATAFGVDLDSETAGLSANHKGARP